MARGCASCGRTSTKRNIVHSASSTQKALVAQSTGAVYGPKDTYFIKARYTGDTINFVSNVKGLTYGVMVNNTIRVVHIQDVLANESIFDVLPESLQIYNDYRTQSGLQPLSEPEPIDVALSYHDLLKVPGIGKTKADTIIVNGHATVRRVLANIDSYLSGTKVDIAKEYLGELL